MLWMDTQFGSSPVKAVRWLVRRPLLTITTAQPHADALQSQLWLHVVSPTLQEIRPTSCKRVTRVDEHT